jgi:hypothetical protein
MDLVKEEVITMTGTEKEIETEIEVMIEEVMMIAETEIEATVIEEAVMIVVEIEIEIETEVIQIVSLESFNLSKMYSLFLL